MIKRITALSLVIAAGFAGGLALGQQVALAQDAITFTQVDQNMDGVISEAEFLMAMPDATAEMFAQADVNADTVMTEDEFEAYQTLMQ